MNNFYNTLAYINETFYAPARLTVTSVREEPQNAEYGAGLFQLNNLSVRFRVGKITPTKTGQFVVFWEKDAERKNRALSYTDAPDLLVINTFHPVSGEIGQFVFPKDVLRMHGVLAYGDAPGKMAMRVYPDWDTVTSKQASAAQNWQLPYFSRVDPMNGQHMQALTRLYAPEIRMTLTSEEIQL
ncbi:MepB family protein [Paenibacillus borealis]|uniref:MepB family protein n=1 Tax=Paenibacillus borealis TaxID=160799 RepID=UPI0005A8F747|nr:MepB family protein [Paenibacillus borealis]